MFPVIFEIIIYLKIFLIMAVSIYILFSKKNEPENFPEKFSKVYVLQSKDSTNKNI